MPIKKIISGAQWGSDIGGLEAALYCDIPYGGWIPKGRKAEKGIVPRKYDQLREMKSADYLARTEANVVDSDATLVLTYGEATGGSKRTIEFAEKHHKPVLHVAIDQYSPEDAALFVKKWFDGEMTELVPPKECVLNVAGSRESKAPGIQDKTMAVIIEVINKVNGVCFYPIRAEG